jgi:enoyl-[acyl-carrier protein] reductase II
MSLRTPICDLFGIEHPIFLAGMGGVAYAEVCAAVCEAGGFGTLGMVAASPARIRDEMRAVRKLTRKPFGVDMLAALPEQMNAAIDTIIDEGAAAFITGLGVAAPLIDKCQRRGVKVMAVCGKVSHAQRAEQAGCDAVVAQGTEAGGHTGQVAGFALLPQTVDAVRIPVLAAGAIVDGRGLAAALALGAQGVWVGTRFVASTEAHAARGYKQRIVDAAGDQTSITRAYSGKPMRVIRNDYVTEWAQREHEILPFPQQLTASARAGVMNLADDAGDPERACMPAGQGVGGIHEVLSSREIIERMLAEARETLARLGNLARAHA